MKRVLNWPCLLLVIVALFVVMVVATPAEAQVRCRKCSDNSELCYDQIWPNEQGREFCYTWQMYLGETWFNVCEESGDICYGDPIGPCPCEEDQSLPCDCPLASQQRAAEAKALATQNDTNARALMEVLGLSRGSDVVALVADRAGVGKSGTTPEALLITEGAFDAGLRAALADVIKRPIRHGAALHAAPSRAAPE